MLLKKKKNACFNTPLPVGQISELGPITYSLNVDSRGLYWPKQTNKQKQKLRERFAVCPMVTEAHRDTPSVPLPPWTCLCHPEWRLILAGCGAWSVIGRCQCIWWPTLSSIPRNDSSPVCTCSGNSLALRDARGSFAPCCCLGNRSVGGLDLKESTWLGNLIS